MSDEKDEQSRVGDFGANSGAPTDDPSGEGAESGVASFSTELFENPDEALAPDDTESKEQAALNEVFKEYLHDIDGRLIEAGWLFLPNKSVEYGKVDQSMLNHTRNLVFFLHRLATQAESAGLRTITPKELRHLIALAVVHDYHKLREEDEDREKRFDITIAELEPFVEKIGLQEFSADPAHEGSMLEMRVLRACAVDHHDTENAKSTNVPLLWEDYRPFIRLADGMASSTTPEAATDTRLQNRFCEAFPGADVNLEHHRIDHVSGIFTNLVNAAVSEHLQKEFDYKLLTIYQDGCVYLAPTDGPDLKSDGELVTEVADQLSKNISETHPSYEDLDQIQSNFSIDGPHGLYSLNEPDFYYVGAQRMLRAVVRKGVTDGESDKDQGDPARKSMKVLEEDLERTFVKTEQQYGLGRFVNTIKRSFIRPLLDRDATNTDLIRATVDVFDLQEDLAEQLVKLPDETSSLLTDGGKWEYSYAVAQELLERHGEGPAIPNAEDELVATVESGLAKIVNDGDDWWQIIRNEHAGEIRKEVRTFIGECLRVGSGEITSSESTVDTFGEYMKKSRGKTCTLCSRGIAIGENLGAMKSKKSLTTLQAGYSNREMIGGMRREKLLLCSVCRIEFSLRETAANRRSPNRLFFHLVPDYFFTPFSWQLYSRTINRFTGENRIRLRRLAEAVFDITSADEFASVMDEMTQPKEGGRTMIESLSQEFDRNRQFGGQTIGYFKPLDNDTEFQFFGAFLALAVSAYTGMRVYLSASPIPEMRSRDFREFVKIGGGFSQVVEFYGNAVSLSGLQDRVQAAAALIKLGYALQFYKFDNKPVSRRYNDSLFAKYLRVARDEMLPGAHLFKRASQLETESSDDGPYIPALMRYAVTLDEQAGIKQHGSNMSDTPHDRITQLADLAYDAIRPASGHNRKPHRVERVFRESVKAVSNTGDQLSRDDYEMLVSGRLQKRIVPEDVDAVYPVSAEMSNAGTPLQERIEEYAAFFVDEILYGLANGRPSELKRIKNGLADGFYGATLRAESKFYEERDEDSQDEGADTGME